MSDTSNFWVSTCTANPQVSHWCKICLTCIPLGMNLLDFQKTEREFIMIFKDVDFWIYAFSEAVNQLLYFIPVHMKSYMNRNNVNMFLGSWFENIQLFLWIVVLYIYLGSWMKISVRASMTEKYLVCFKLTWPPLWSSGQSSCLQIRRPGFDSRHYQKKKVICLERGPLSLVSTTEKLL
jgi:hypothetical protein